MLPNTRPRVPMLEAGAWLIVEDRNSHGYSVNSSERETAYVVKKVAVVKTKLKTITNRAFTEIDINFGFTASHS